MTERNDLLVKQMHEVKKEALKTQDMVNKSVLQQRTASDARFVAILELLKNGKANSEAIGQAANLLLEQMQKNQETGKSLASYR